MLAPKESLVGWPVPASPAGTLLQLDMLPELPPTDPPALAPQPLASPAGSVRDNDSDVAVCSPVPHSPSGPGRGSQFDAFEMDVAQSLQLFSEPGGGCGGVSPRARQLAQAYVGSGDHEDQDHQGLVDMYTTALQSAFAFTSDSDLNTLAEVDPAVPFQAPAVSHMPTLPSPDPQPPVTPADPQSPVCTPSPRKFYRHSSFESMLEPTPSPHIFPAWKRTSTPPRRPAQSDEWPSFTPTKTPYFIESKAPRPTSGTLESKAPHPTSGTLHDELVPLLSRGPTPFLQHYAVVESTLGEGTPEHVSYGEGYGALVRGHNAFVELGVKARTKVTMAGSHGGFDNHKVEPPADGLERRRKLSPPRPANRVEEVRPRTARTAGGTATLPVEVYCRSDVEQGFDPRPPTSARAWVAAMCPPPRFHGPALEALNLAGNQVKGSN